MRSPGRRARVVDDVSTARKLEAPGLILGPYTAADVRPGAPHEVSDGFLLDCMGTGQRGSRSNGSGFMVLDSDPDAPAAGVDAGISPVPSMLRAPDIAVGGLQDEPGWSSVAPPLCVEYADRGAVDNGTPAAASSSDALRDALRLGSSA